MIMRNLSTPDQDVVSRVTRKVRFEDRLVGYRVRRRAGAIAVALYSVEEVVHLLNDRFPQLSLERLEEWLRAVIRDEELANRIVEVAHVETNDREKMLQVRSLMRERLCQCKTTRA
jgi:hypothetical protein